MAAMSDQSSQTMQAVRDRLYDKPQPQQAFAFDERVAAVFPDMIERSVPGYRFVLQTIAQTVAHLVQPHSRLYDLGCSLGAITLAMRAGLDDAGQRSTDSRIVAVDSAPAMVRRAQEHIAVFRATHPIDLVCADLRDIAIEAASVVVMAYTLQFLSPEERLPVLRRIHDGLLPGGGLILVEKTHEEDTAMQSLITELHHDFKRANGYSDLEIAQKRQALENVLRTETVATHEARLREAGFTSLAMVARHHGFTAWIALKATT